jgi:protein tyrosine/serine phosphatase
MTRPVPSKTVAALIRPLKVGILAVGLTAGSIGSYWGVVQYHGNFHSVSQGAFYRSAQLLKGEQEKAVRDHGIRAIRNLRGAHPGEASYDDEVAVSKALGVLHYDCALSARRVVTGEQITELLGIMRFASKPLLVHRKSGADRTGLISALYRFAVEGKNADEADRQLTLIYGHFPYLASRTSAVDDSFWAFVGKQTTAATSEEN